MHKNFLLILFVFVLLIFSALPAVALSISIDSQGTMVFKQGTVLGDEIQEEDKDAQEQIAEQTKQRQEFQKEDQEQLREQLKKKEERKREENKKVLEAVRELKKVSAKENKQLRIKQQNGKVEVLLEKKGVRAGSSSADRVMKMEVQERMEVEDLELDLSRGGGKKGEENLEIRTLRKNSGINEEEMELKIGSISARLKSAQFVLDPTTNVVTLITPSGKVHELRHLPDQALQQMQKVIVLAAPGASQSGDMQIENQEDGSVLYKTRVRTNKKFLGLIPYIHEYEATMRDETGETKLSTTSRSPLVQFLLSLGRN